ncbi:MAG: chaperone modulatory protein CbpM [Alphaproteobacteria bacterium]|jgi:chaperone modulatory protein CbpM
MTPVDDLIAAIEVLRRSDLEAWIDQNLVKPQQDAETLYFTDMECARVHLICTLHYDLEIDGDALPVMLSLIDQLYDTRQRLLSLSAAIAAQDESIQAAILAAMRPDDDSPAGGASKV